MNMEAMIDKYFRPGRLPHIWCPGCGNGVVTGTIVKAVAKLDLDKDKVAVISGKMCIRDSDKAVINYMCDRQLYMQEGRIT